MAFPAVPAVGHNLSRAARVVPNGIPNADTSVSQTQIYQVYGSEVAITAHIQWERYSSYGCCDDFHCMFTIIEDGEEEKTLGHLKAKRVKRGKPASQDKTPRWVKKLLRCPADYDGGMLEHSGDDDPMSDLHKVLQMLYDPDGNPKEELCPALKAILEEENVHYIEIFSLEPDYRGKGLAKLAMMTYFMGLRMTRDFRDRTNGGILLSPAPIQEETTAMRQAGLEVKPYDVVVGDIGRSYEKSGFKWVYRGRNLENGAISIMARPSTDVNLTDDGEDYLFHEDEETAPDDADMMDVEDEEEQEEHDSMEDSDSEEEDDEMDEDYPGDESEEDETDEEADIEDEKREIRKRQRRRVTVMRKVPNDEKRMLKWQYNPDPQPMDRFDTDPNHYPPGAKWFQTLQPQKDYYIPR